MTTPRDACSPAAHAAQPRRGRRCVTRQRRPGTPAPAARDRRAGAWPWALGAVAANHAVLTAAGLWPRSRWLGRNWTRLPAHAAARREIAITIDDGPDPEVTPAVLDLLDAHGARATFFCIAAARARAPGAVPRDRRAAATACRTTATATRTTSRCSGRAAMAREIARAQASLADITGERRASFARRPGLRNPFLAPVLQRLGLQLVSWTRRGFDTVRREPARRAGAARRAAWRPATSCCCTTATRRAPTTAAPVVLDVLPALLARARAPACGR